MNVEHERALFLPEALAVDIPHRTHNLLLRITLFVLTLVGVLGLYLLLDRFDVPRQGIATGILALVLAEFLILKLRWSWTGVEEALWLGGAYALISEIPRSTDATFLLVLAGAAAVAGLRVRNPLFGALAASFVVAYFENSNDLGVIAGLGIAFAAVLGLLRTWRRPSNEFLCIALAIILPVVGYFYADAKWRTTTIAFYAAFGFVTFVLGVFRRHHALFLSGGIGLAIAAIELARAFPSVALEAKLAIGGAILLGASWLVSRALRESTLGIVSTREKLTPFDDELEIIATTALPREEFPQKAEPEGQFGGAGATGKY